MTSWKACSTNLSIFYINVSNFTNVEQKHVGMPYFGEASRLGIYFKHLRKTWHQITQKTKSTQLNVNLHCLLTSRESIPDLEPVVAAEYTSWGCRIGLQLEAFKLQNDFWHLWGKYHKCTVQIVGILLWEPGWLYDADVGGKVPGTLRTCKKDKGTTLIGECNGIQLDKSKGKR